MSSEINGPRGGSPHRNLGGLIGPPEGPSRSDVEPNPAWEDILERLRAGYWQAAKFLWQLARDNGACFQPLSEDDSVDCLRRFLVTAALKIEKQCLQEQVSSLRLERTAAGVNVLFGKDSIADFSALIQTAATETDQLSPDAASIVSKVFVDELFADEICLPGFARNRDSLPDTLILDLLPEDAENQLLDFERHRRKPQAPN
jgi:hypothetical protein